MIVVTPAIATTVAAVRGQVHHAREQGLSVGLVPTMGALHEGHASLIRLAAAETPFVVVSIFVNPLQFGPNEDLARYPRTWEADVEVCRREGVSLIFAPANEIMYPPGFVTKVEVERLQDGLCGASRPGHFRGVATVVLKLLNIVQPDIAYFGQKDAQQARLLQQMVQDLDVPVKIRIGPIVREPDGLALSSRNRYLDPIPRRQAVVLYEALREAQAALEGGGRDVLAIKRELEARIAATQGAVLDYAAIVDADSLQPITAPTKRMLVAVAVKFGATRLIDNVVVAGQPSEPPG